MCFSLKTSEHKYSLTTSRASVTSNGWLVLLISSPVRELAVPKGVNCFDYCTKANVIITAGKYTVHLSILPLTLWPLDCISNYTCWLPYNLHDVTEEDLVLDQLVIPSLIFFFILITCLLLIVLYCRQKFGLDPSWQLKGSAC